MTSTLVSTLSDLTSSNISMLLLLAKATVILLLALGMTVVMQRASAGSRHLVWLVTVAGLLFVPALTAWAPLPVRILPAVRLLSNPYAPYSGAEKSSESVAAKKDAAVPAPAPTSSIAPANSSASTVSES